MHVPVIYYPRRPKVASAQAKKRRSTGEAALRKPRVISTHATTSAAHGELLLWADKRKSLPGSVRLCRLRKTKNRNAKRARARSREREGKKRPRLRIRARQREATTIFGWVSPHTGGAPRFIEKQIRDKIILATNAKRKNALKAEYARKLIQKCR